MSDIFQADKNYLRSRNSCSGSVLVELACSSVFVVIFAIFAVYMSLLLICAHITDRACRDAARAAGQARSQSASISDQEQASAVATSILKAYASANPFMTAPTLQNLVYEDFGGSPPSDTSPYVTVTVVSSARLPFAPVTLFGNIYGSDQYTFSQTYTFPIINTR
ncbi:MAG: hypothetical protein K2X27_00725 [Candidatus Obscuribacterales bacterium]|nr:hypothetical protein [Candidatus Obscuribacterales bacterium]